MQEFYTYCHTRNDTGKIFYIGKGTKNRAFSCAKRNPHWQNIVNKCGHNVKILAYWENEQKAFDHEKLLISCFKDMGYRLVNMTDGGDGQTGLVHSSKTKEKISNALIGRKFSTEHKEKIAEGNRKKIISKETCQKISQSKLGKKHSFEHKKKISDGLKRKHNEKNNIN